MKKYFSIFIILFLILIPFADAEESVITCSNSKNLFDGIFIKGGYKIVNKKPTNFDPDSTILVTSSSFIEVSPDTIYFYSQSYGFGTLYILFFDESFNGIGSFSYSRNNVFSFTTTSATKFIKIMNQSYGLDVGFWSSYNNGTGWSQLELGDVQTDYVPFEECVPINPDSTLDNFYSIYLDKLKLLSDYVLENKFFFSAIGIILLFIVLEFILHLFFINRRR